MRVVLDTNILISALLFGGIPDRIIELIRAKRIDCYLSPFILHEFENILRNKFEFSSIAAQEASCNIESLSRIIRPLKKITIITRKDSDNRILECALAAKAHVLITGNMKDIRSLVSFHKIKILTPREFIDTYFPLH
jgi:hypothetical protein